MLTIILKLGTRLFCSSSLGLVTLIAMGEIQDGCTVITVYRPLYCCFQGLLTALLKCCNWVLHFRQQRQCFPTLLQSGIKQTVLSSKVYIWFAHDVIDHHCWWNLHVWKAIMLGWEFSTAVTRMHFSIVYHQTWRSMTHCANTLFDLWTS